MAPLPPQPVTPPLQHRGETTSPSAPSCSHGRPEWNDDVSTEVKGDTELSDIEEDDMNDNVPDDVPVEPTLGKYRIIQLRQIRKSLEHVVCRECAEQTPLLVTSIGFEEVTHGIATELFFRCNAKEEHGDSATTHSWKVGAQRRQAPPGEKDSIASFTINYWFMGMVQYMGLGISHIEAFLGYLGMKGQVDDTRGWHTVEERLGHDGEEHKNSCSVPHGYSN
jgi:hypothetical protein